jgi:hypothetical protein
MQITDRHRWLVVAGLASFAASQVATRLSAESWRLAAGNDPPEDPTDRDFNWTSALVFGAAAGAAAGIAVILARGGAGKAWRKSTGRKPPRSPRRSKRN